MKQCLIYKTWGSQVLELGGLPRLMKMVKSSFKQEAAKALYAISALVRNNVDGQELFYAEAGDLMLQVSGCGFQYCHLTFMFGTDMSNYLLSCRTY